MITQTGYVEKDDGRLERVMIDNKIAPQKKEEVIVATNLLKRIINNRCAKLAVGWDFSELLK